MTPTKEDVIRWAEQQFSKNWVRMNAEYLAAFATAVRADLVAENERLKLFVESEAFRTQAVSPQILPTSPGGGDDSTGTIPDMYHEREKCMVCLQDDKQELLQQLQESQAREMKLRASLLVHGLQLNTDKTKSEIKEELDRLFPSDSTALRELIAGVYEECAKVCENTRMALEENKAVWEKNPCLKPDDEWIDDWESSACRGQEYAAEIRALAEKAKGE